jgi:hypothetical protein
MSLPAHELKQAILVAARVCELKQLAARTSATFAAAERSTELPRARIASLMLQYLDAYRERREVR